MTEPPVDQPGSYPGGSPPPEPYYGYPPPPTQPRNGLGIAALVIGILAIPAALLMGGGIPLGIVALVLGIVGWRRSKRGEATNGGVAIAGIVLGALGIVVSVALIAIGVAFFEWMGGGDYVSCLNKAGNDRVKQQQCEEQFNKHVENKFSVTLTTTPAP